MLGEEAVGSVSGYLTFGGLLILVGFWVWVFFFIFLLKGKAYCEGVGDDCRKGLRQKEFGKGT